MKTVPLIVVVLCADAGLQKTIPIASRRSAIEPTEIRAYLRMEARSGWTKRIDAAIAMVLPLDMFASAPVDTQGYRQDSYKCMARRPRKLFLRREPIGTM